MGEIFDEFDESKLHRQNFPFQYFAIGIQEFKCLYTNNLWPIEGSVRIYWVMMSMLSLVWPDHYF